MEINITTRTKMALVIMVTVMRTGTIKKITTIRRNKSQNNRLLSKSSESIRVVCSYIQHRIGDELLFLILKANSFLVTYRSMPVTNEVLVKYSSTELIMKKAIFRYSFFAALALIVLSSCSKNQKSSADNTKASLQVRLTDGPDANVREVWVDIQQIEIIMSDTSHPIILDGAHPGLYNLLDFSDGKDTILADATIPPGATQSDSFNTGR